MSTAYRVHISLSILQRSLVVNVVRLTVLVVSSDFVVLLAVGLFCSAAGWEGAWRPQR